MENPNLYVYSYTLDTNSFYSQNKLKKSKKGLISINSCFKCIFNTRTYLISTHSTNCKSQEAEWKSIGMCI